jgi:hypothetical protein
MSLMILGSIHANYLATAAAAFGAIDAQEAAELAQTLLTENIDAYLLAYWDGPGTFDDWDKLDEDEKDSELVQIHRSRTEHQYRPAAGDLAPERVRAAIQRWQYQVSVVPECEQLTGWQAMSRLDAALPA